MEFHGIVNCEGILQFPPIQEKLRMRLLQECAGKCLTERLSVSGRAKSSNQVKAHFGLAVTMIRDRMMELGWDICGVPPNKEMVHEILLRACGGVGPLGESVRLSLMTTEQASKFFENIRAWSATQLNLDIPDPDPHWRDKPCRGRRRCAERE